MTWRDECRGTKKLAYLDCIGLWRATVFGGLSSSMRENVWCSWAVDGWKLQELVQLRSCLCQNLRHVTSWWIRPQPWAMDNPKLRHLCIGLSSSILYHEFDASCHKLAYAKTLGSALDVKTLQWGVPGHNLGPRRFRVWRKLASLATTLGLNDFWSLEKIGFHGHNLGPKWLLESGEIGFLGHSVSQNEFWSLEKVGFFWSVHPWCEGQHWWPDKNRWLVNDNIHIAIIPHL